MSPGKTYRKHKKIRPLRVTHISVPVYCPTVSPTLQMSAIDMSLVRHTKNGANSPRANCHPRCDNNRESPDYEFEEFVI